MKCTPYPEVFAAVSLSGGKIFSKLDLSYAYLQLQLDESSQEYVTIHTHRGHQLFSTYAGDGAQGDVNGCCISKVRAIKEAPEPLHSSHFLVLSITIPNFYNFLRQITEKF